MVMMDAEALDMVKAYHEHQAFDAWQHLIPTALRKTVLHGGQAIIELETEKSV